MKSGSRNIVTAESLDSEGRGIAHSEGRQVAVGDLLPGEHADVVIEHVSPNRPLAWARIQHRRGKPSADRVQPACPGFGRCGGCVWQHLAYSAQLTEKKQRVEHALAGLEINVADVVPSPLELGYRNKGSYVVGARGDHIVLGAYAPRSHDLVDTLGCLVVTNAIDRVAHHTRDALERSPLVPYDERARRGDARYVVIRDDGHGQTLVALVTAADTDRSAAVDCASDIATADGVVGVVWFRNDSTSSKILAGDNDVVAGAATLSIDLCGTRIEVGVSAFLQINWRQTEQLYSRLASAVGADASTRAVDLYCGVGGIARELASRGASVIGIERDEAMIEAARAAVGAGEISFEHGEAAQLASILERHGIEPTLVVVNPPRRGLDDHTLAALRSLAPATIGYVSCSPESLARDLTALAGDGYAIGTVTPVDLMPGTGQIECVVALTR